MTIAQILWVSFALSVPAVGLVVGARLVRCAYRSLRASRAGPAVLSVLAIASLCALLAAVVAVWLGYAVAHSQKDLASDLRLALFTGVPFYAASYGLWRLAPRLESASGGRAPGSPSG